MLRRSAALFLTAGITATALCGLGCKSSAPDPHDVPEEPGIPEAKLKAMMAADKVISEGEVKIAEGKKKNDAAMVQEGETIKARGNQMMAEARKMPG